MQGPIVQTIGLVLAANAFKRGLPLSDSWSDSTIFQFCKYVRFVDGKASGLFRKSHRILAEDPTQWLRKCVGQFAGARVHVVIRNDPNTSGRASVGFVGGGPRWIIELVGEDFSELWEARWEVGDNDAPDRRIWGVEYIRISDRWGGMPEPARDLGAIRGDLDEKLLQIAAFANAYKLSNFAQCFEHGRSILHSNEPLAETYHSDLAPRGLLTRPAEQLLAAAQAAWVFGGMGSWNDIWFEGDGSEYEQLSDQLFALLTEAAATATNTCYPG